ncbi:MAG: hypothetical protein J6A85_07740 [Clostridia bacterium]|nr:hypothetical protein [Clostridia bacterium]
MKARGKNGSYFSRLIGGSRIWSRFFSVDSVSSHRENGSLREENMFSQSLLGSLYGTAARFAARARTFCASYAEKSKIFSALSSFFRGLMDTSVSSVGVFLFFTAMYSAAMYVVKLYAGRPADTFDLIYSVVIALMGIFLLPVRRSLLGCVRQGILTSYITEEMLAVSSFALDTEKQGKKHVGWAVLFGTVAGLAGFLFSPLDIVLFLLAVALCAVVIYSPEGGLYISAFLLPFVPSYVSASVAVLAGISYLLKLLVGKRNFYLTTADIFVFLFTLAMGAAGITTPFGSESTAVTVLTVAVLYILCVNLMRSGDQLFRLMRALNSGALMLALCCIFSFFFPDELGAFGAAVSEKINYVTMLPLLLPASLCVTFVRGAFSSGLITVFAIYTAVALTFSEWLYIAAIVITVLFLVSSFRKRVGIILGGALSVGGVMVLFGTGIINGEMLNVTLGSAAETATAWKYAPWGIGFGEKAFNFAFRSTGYGDAVPTDLYSAITVAGGVLSLLLFAVMLTLLLRRGMSVMKGKTVKIFKYPAAAALSAVCAFVLYGFFGGTWDLFANILLFAVTCGCMSCLPRVYEREVGEEYEIK